MKYYIKNGKVYPTPNDLSKSNGIEVGKDISEQVTKFVELSEKQYQFRVDNPSASIEEIWECKLREAVEVELAPAERREQEYARRISRSLLDAYTTYLAEGATEKAEVIAVEIRTVKAEIRTEIPD